MTRADRSCSCRPCREPNHILSCGVQRVMIIQLPGLVDLQINGFGGVDFNASDLAADRVDAALDRIRATGVTRCLPTLITSSYDDFSVRARVLSGVPSPAIAGIHMEGPYI